MASTLNGNPAADASPQSDIHFAYFLSKPLIAWNPLLSGMHTWMCKCHSTQASLQQEWAGFVGRRLQKDAALPQKLADVKAPGDAWHIYVDFVEQAVEDYRTEYATLTKLGTSFASQSVNDNDADAGPGSPAKLANGQSAGRNADTSHKVAAHVDE